MTDLDGPVGPDHGDGSADEPRVRAFWEVAKRHAKLGRMPGWFGPSALESVPPPAWSLGFSRGEADQSLAALLERGSVVIEVAVSDYAGEPLPCVGTLGIVLDGADEPRALVATGAVDVLGDRVVERIDLLYPRPPRRAGVSDLLAPW